MAEMEVELPRALIKRIVKAKLAEQADLGDDEGKRDFQLNKDATTAFSQASKVFLTYVRSAAHDICRENNRSTVAPQDIIQALDDLCFQDFVPDLQDLLTGMCRLVLSLVSVLRTVGSRVSSGCEQHGFQLPQLSQSSISLMISIHQ